MEARTDPVGILISYSHIDERLLKKLEKHLIPLKRQGLLTFSHSYRYQKGYHR